MNVQIRPCLSASGTLVAPYSSWPSVPWCCISNRHSPYQGCHSPETHGRNQGTWSMGRLPHPRRCSTRPTRSWNYLAEAEARFLPQLAGSLLSLPHQSGWRACRTHQVPICPCAKHRADTTSSFSTVLSRCLISRDLVETKSEIPTLPPTAWSSFLQKAETSPSFLRNRRTSSFLVLRIDRISSPAIQGSTFAFISFKMSA